jgi:hypothetical protein
MDEPKRCGTLVELVKTSGVRVQRCACGMIHLTVLKNGVTMQLSEDDFSALARGVAAAAGELEPARPSVSPLRSSGERIN